VGANKRGNAMLTREKIKVTKLKLLTSGWGMAAYCRGVWLGNIYVPPGLSNKLERKTFYSVELTHCLQK